MRIYDNMQTYRAYSGKPAGFQKRYKETRCDLTGEVIEDNGVSFDVSYGNTDPCFGADDIEYDFGKEFNVTMYEFLSEPYEFSPDIDDTLIISLRTKREHDPEGSATLEGAFRLMRIETAKRLIAEGLIKPENLAGHRA